MVVALSVLMLLCFPSSIFSNANTESSAISEESIWIGETANKVKARVDETFHSLIEGGNEARTMLYEGGKDVQANIAKQFEDTVHSFVESKNEAVHSVNEARAMLYEGGKDVAEQMYQSVDKAQTTIQDSVRWWNVNLNHIGDWGWDVVHSLVTRYKTWLGEHYIFCDTDVKIPAIGECEEPGMLLTAVRQMLHIIHSIPLLYLLVGFTILCLVFGSWATLRLPILIGVCLSLVFEFQFYWLVRILIHLLEWFPPIKPLYWFLPIPIPRLRWALKRRKIALKMKKAKNYSSWRELAVEMSELHEREKWKEMSEDPNYHCRLVVAATQRLQWARTNKDYIHLIETLTPCMVKNFGGTMNIHLYSQTHTGTKRVVDEFFREVKLSLEWVTQVTQSSLKLDDKRWEEFKARRVRFLRSAKRSFGNTAFLMSGGATLGLYHIGIIKGLAYSGLGFPKVICGTSAGSVLTAFMGVRTDDEIRASFEVGEDGLDDWWEQFGPKGPFHGSWLWKLSQLHKKGRMYDYSEFMKHLSWFVGENLGLVNPTFREAFDRTGRLINITCTPFKTKVKGSPPLILNHLTAPDVTLASAVCASSCVPMLIEPVALLEKAKDGSLRPYEAHSPISSQVRSPKGDAIEFDIPLEHIKMRDGTFESDVPVMAISELFNCHFSIVSQVNPHIIPFFYHNRGRDGRPSTWRLWAGGWRGGFILSALELWLKEDMLKSLRVLAGLDLLIEVFGVNWSYLYLQDARGDVTMLPDVTIRDYLYIIDNLDVKEDLIRRVTASQSNFWQCMSRIEHRLSVQSVLDGACTSLGIGEIT